MAVCMVGWSHSRFGKLESETLESLIARVATDAIADAGLTPDAIDEIYVGTFNGGMVRQESPSSLVLQIDPALRFKPSTRVENACATGSAAIYQGLNAIASGKSRRVLVVGVEKMTEASNPAITDILIRCSYVPEEGDTPGGFPGVFGRITELYFQRYGDKSESLARIAAKNHRNGSINPLAHVQKDLGFDFCNSVSDKNPIVAGPLRRTDCSMVSDGAAALVLADVDTAMTMKKAVVFRAAAHVNDFLPLSKRDIVAFEGPAEAWRQALGTAHVGIDDLDLVEVHDCFTTAEILAYEAMGLASHGGGARAIDEGWSEKGGRLPVNPSGGLKAKGHPIGATGVSMHVLAAMQLTGTAGGMQIDGASLAATFNMGGAAVANYVSILERLR